MCGPGDSHMNSVYSFSNLLIGVRQSSILRPHLFNIYIYDVFFYREQTEDITPLRTNILTVLIDLKNKSSTAFDWFAKNYLKAIPDKSNLLLTFKEGTSVQTGGYVITNCTSKNY